MKMEKKEENSQMHEENNIEIIQAEMGKGELEIDLEGRTVVRATPKNAVMGNEIK